MDKKWDERMIVHDDTGMLQSESVKNHLDQSLEKKINWFENHFAQAQNVQHRNMEDDIQTTSWNPAAIDFGKGHIHLANVQREIISETLFDDAQIPPQLPFPNNPVVLDEVHTQEGHEEEVPELEGDKE
uniref:Uncharacterized protein n=1 Tax=Romanomermis culicivorax TaxID=13658 RepID=A0A915HQS9_ROMCU